MSGEYDKYLMKVISLHFRAFKDNDLDSLFCRLFKKKYVRTFGLGFYLNHQMHG